MATFKAAIWYFAIVFACGFVLGTFRILLVMPRLGEWNAVLLELPLMVVASWLSCQWVVARLQVARALQPRLAMGALAFAILMLAELGLSVFGMVRTVAEHFALYQTAPALMGLIAQLAFAIFPVVQLKAQLIRA